MLSRSTRAAAGALALAAPLAGALRAQGPTADPNARAGRTPPSGASVVPTATAVAPRRAPAALGPLLLGVVRDSAGAPLADAQVVIAALNRSVTTDDSGRFGFRGLAPGRYHLDVLLIGYARADADVTIPAEGADVRVTITMRRTVLQLQNVVVAATPTGGDPLRLTQSTASLSGRELARSLGGNVATTLSSEPGLAVRFAGPGATTPVIRGLTGERILVLQDGDRAGDLSSASSDHGLSIDPLVANRIEVVRGPASLLYGTNALGGVVNVVTNDIPSEVPTHRDATVSLQSESVSPSAAGAVGVVVPLGSSLAVNARVGVRRADDLYQGGRTRLDNSSNRTENALASVGWVGDAARGGLSFGTYGFDYGLPAAPGDDRSHIRGDRQELRGRFESNLDAGPLRSAKFEGSAQWYGHDEIEQDGTVGTSFGLRTQTANLTARTRVGRVEGAVGAQGLFRQYESTGEEALTPGANTTVGGLFLYQELPLTGADDDHGADDHGRGVRLQLGARVDAVRLRTQAGDPKFGPATSRAFTSGSGSVGLSVPLADRVSLGVSAARAFRAPTVEELYSNAFHAAVGTYDVGNPNLRAETNQGVDAVLRAQRGKVDAQIAGYWNAIANYVTPTITGLVDPDRGTPVPAGTRGAVPLNRFAQQDARMYGAEGRVEVAVAPRIVLGTMGDIVRGSFVNGGGALPYLPPARLGLTARWDDGRRSVGGEVRRTFAQDRTSQPTCGVAGTDGPDAQPGTAGIPCLDLRTPAFTLVNLSASWTLPFGNGLHTLTLRGDNLLDARYFDATSRIKAFAGSPGRNVSLVYRVQL